MSVKIIDNFLDKKLFFKIKSILTGNEKIRVNINIKE